MPSFSSETAWRTEQWTSRRDLIQAAKAGLGKWLQESARWEWFVTITFRDPTPRGTPSIPATEGMDTLFAEGSGHHGYNRKGWAFATATWERFIAAVRKPFSCLDYAMVFERQKRGVVHIHALVGNVNPDIMRLELQEEYWNTIGMARFKKYDASLGASYYLGKYLAKDDYKLELSESLGG